MIGLGWVHHASYLVTVFVEKKAKKGEPKSAVSQTLEFLGARNWTKVASSDRRIFSREGIVQERSILGSCHVMSCHVMSCHVMSCHVMSCARQYEN